MKGEIEHEKLTREQQLIAFGVGSLLSGVLVVTVVFLVQLSRTWNPTGDPGSQLLILAALGGLFGGSSRALFMFHSEVGGHAEKPAAHYLQRWFLFVFKPFIGGASGTLFVLAADFGVVRALTDSTPKFEFLPTALLAAIGGIFFEEVYGVLNNLVRTLHPSRSGGPTQKG